MPTFVFMVIMVILIVTIIPVAVVIVIVVIIIFTPTEVLGYVSTPPSHGPRSAWYMTFEMGSDVIQPRGPVRQLHPTKTTWTSISV
jgi:hypothetical protein